MELINIEIFCRCLLAIVFACSALAKLRDGAAFRGFRAWLGDLPVPVAARHPTASAVAVAGAEVLIVVLTVLPWTVLAGFALAGATLAVFIAGTGLAIARGTKAPCNCFGSRGSRGSRDAQDARGVRDPHGAHDTPLGPRHVARDAVLLAVAIAGAATSNAHGARPAGVVLSAAAAVFLAIGVVFLDDVLSVFAVGSPDLAGSPPRQG